MCIRDSPARCDKPWFCNTFCAGKGGDRTEDDSVWDLVVSFNMYDPLALMACVPDLRRRFFRCVEKRVDGVAHSVIGTSKDAPGVDEENVRPLRDFMYRGFFKGATLNFSSYTKLDADTMPTRLRDLAREVASVAKNAYACVRSLPAIIPRLPNYKDPTDAFTFRAHHFAYTTAVSERFGVCYDPRLEKKLWGCGKLSSIAINAVCSGTVSYTHLTLPTKA